MLNGGTVTLNGTSSITNNTAPNGGGILNLFGTVTLNNSGSITGNTAGSVGGGIYNLFGTVTLNNSGSITGNTAGTDGGGIYNNFTFGGSVTLNDTSSITNNNPNNCAPPGSVPAAPAETRRPARASPTCVGLARAYSGRGTRARRQAVIVLPAELGPLVRMGWRWWFRSPAWG
jgi:hypothetical protein